MSTTTITYEHAGSTVELELKDKYDLVYVDYRDELSREQVAMIVRGDFEALWESLSEYESEGQYQGAKYVADELLADAEIDPDEFEPYQGLIDAVRERDSGDWVKQIVRATPDVLLRINVIDEDHGYSFEAVEPERVLGDIGLPTTDANLRTIAKALAECSPEFSVLMGYWIVGADVGELYELDTDADVEVEITDPYLYLGNPFAGSGWITEEPLEGAVRVKRGDLRTDRDAFGYSVDEVYGGLTPSGFSCPLKLVTAQA